MGVHELHFTKRDSMYTHNGTLKGLKNFILSGQWLQGPAVCQSL